MKIENNNISNANFNKTEAANQVDKQHSTASSNNTSAVPSKDKAELSDNARLLSKARIALNETPEVDQAKVDDLKAKIQKGEYNIPYENLADKMYSKLGLK
ncbi:MAG: flagellar biosynthesis anti-sigma factor FlgM [Anaerolinea sp.]|nr:flagellar biosynthesis anti-sigma factor FlgM [Anaerolinea sp.]